MSETVIVKKNKSIGKKRILLFSLLIVLFITSLLVGRIQEVNIKNLIQGDAYAWLVLVQSRLPRSLAIILTASSLSVVGLIMQSIGRNKFISPSTVGATDAALLGIVLSQLILGITSIYLQAIFAFIFSFVGVLFFLFVLQKIKFKDVVYVPLIGIMYGAVLSAITLFIAQSLNKLEYVSKLSVGSFTLMTNRNFPMLLIVLIPMMIAFLFATKFSIVSAGKDFSLNLGVKYNQVVIVGLIIIAVVSSTTFIVVGPLPFIGVIIPNLVTGFYGDHVKKSIFDIAIFGAVFVLINDILARVIVFPYEVSISLVMGVVGAIIFLIIIFRKVKTS